MNPVLVVGGLDADPGKQESLRVWLASRGYSAYAMTLAGAPTGTAPIAASARAVADKVAQIRAETGAAHVDLVGHSMGGLAQRHYIEFLGGADQTGTYIDYGTPEFGDPLATRCAATAIGCGDLLPTSPFLLQLATKPALPPGLPAYHLYTEDNPVEIAPLPGAINVSVQSFCPGRRLSHSGQPDDGAVRELIDAALRGVPLATTCP